MWILFYDHTNQRVLWNPGLYVMSWKQHCFQNCVEGATFHNRVIINHEQPRFCTDSSDYSQTPTFGKCIMSDHHLTSHTSIQHHLSNTSWPIDLTLKPQPLSTWWLSYLEQKLIKTYFLSVFTAGVFLPLQSVAKTKSHVLEGMYTVYIWLYNGCERCER